MSQEDSYSAEHLINFSEITFIERLKEIIKNLPKQIPLFSTVTVSFWGVAEVIAEITGDKLTLKNLAIPAIATALVISFYRAIEAYFKYYPEALSDESLIAKKIYKKGRSGWQFDLARQMLIDRTSNIDRKLSRIEIGSQFTTPKKLEESEYFSWLENRTEILQRLIKAVAIQCTNELPKILAITNDESKLYDIKDAVNQLSILYEETANFEMESHCIKPPEYFKKLHEMQFGWSNPIRDGINKFLETLNDISKIDVKRISADLNNTPNFRFSFEPPPNIDEFSKELNSLSINL